MCHEPLISSDPLRAISFDGNFITGKDLQRYALSMGMNARLLSEHIPYARQVIDRIFKLGDSPLSDERITIMRPFLENFLTTHDPLPIPIRSSAERRNTFTFSASDHLALISFFSLQKNEYANYLGISERHMSECLNNIIPINNPETVKKIGILNQVASDLKDKGINLSSKDAYKIRKHILSGGYLAIEALNIEQANQTDWRDNISTVKLKRSSYITGNEVEKLRISLGMSKSLFRDEINNISDDLSVTNNMILNIEKSGDRPADFSKIRYGELLQDILCNLYEKKPVYKIPPNLGNSRRAIHFSREDACEIFRKFNLDKENIRNIFGVSIGEASSWLAKEKSISTPKSTKILGMLNTVLYSFYEDKYSAPVTGTRDKGSWEILKNEVKECSSAESLERLLEVFDEYDEFPSIIYDNLLSCNQIIFKDTHYVTENRVS